MISMERRVEIEGEEEKNRGGGRRKEGLKEGEGESAPPMFHPGSVPAFKSHG
jgi:hypothetical protein